MSELSDLALGRKIFLLKNVKSYLVRVLVCLLNLVENLGAKLSVICILIDINNFLHPFYSVSYIILKRLSSTFFFTCPYLDQAYFYRASYYSLFLRKKLSCE